MIVQEEQPTDLRVCRSLALLPRERDELKLYCGSVQRDNGRTIGWLPWAAIDDAHREGRLWACHRNDDLVGFCIIKLAAPVLRIYQIWVRPDARMIEHGRQLLHGPEQALENLKANRIELWCAVDLASNLFWHHLGFSLITWRWGRHKKSRRHFLWRRPILRSSTQVRIAAEQRAEQYELPKRRSFQIALGSAASGDTRRQ